MRIFTLSMAFVFLVLLSGCGQDVCVGGIGQCNVQPVGGKPGAPTLIAPSAHVKAGQSIKLTVVNGTAPFSLAIITGWGQLAVSGPRTAIYEAPAGTGVVVIRVRDAERREATLSLAIE